MRKFLRCGFLFDGLSEDVKSDQTVVVENGVIGYVGPTAEAPRARDGDAIMDHSGAWVLPGLIDIHVHLSYGNAQANEDVDMFAPAEYRAAGCTRRDRSSMPATHRWPILPPLTG